jgi:tRNA-specific 2-thiouridylase
MSRGKVKALVLFSGGLDSILTAEIFKKQGIYVEGLFFNSPFWNLEKAKESAKNISLKLNIIDLDDNYLKIIRKPKFGRGKQMNPCLDCRIFMLRQAKKFMKQNKFDILATGEVLGQRPMTQNKSALNFIEKNSGLSNLPAGEAGKILRPLSAKILKETIYEKKNLVDREKLFSFSGRSRKPQIALAKKWKIKKYPSPAGGCLLTDLEFSKRLKELFEKYPRSKMEDMELLKFGRHFWENKTKIVVGRNEKENKEIRKLAGKKDVLMELKGVPGPLTLIRGKINKKILKKSADLTIRYAKKAKKNAEIKINPAPCSQRGINSTAARTKCIKHSQGAG